MGGQHPAPVGRLPKRPVGGVFGPDVIGGYFENGTMVVYQDGEDGQITAITIDKNGKELKRKNYANYSDLL